MVEEDAVEDRQAQVRVRVLVLAPDQAQAQVVQVVHQVEVAAAPGTQGKHINLSR